MAKPQADGAFLRIDSVVKEFGDFRAVDQVSLDIAKGEIFALLGSSGCGKSTLLRMLAGFETPTSGRIILNGQDLAGKPPYERPVNMMFQSYALFPHMTVADNIAFGLRRDGLPKAEIAQRVEEMLRLVQLTKLAARKPHQLSGGQQQRVALARSLAKRPQLLLLDEPSLGLAPIIIQQIFDIIEQLRKDGVTVFLVEQNANQALKIADRAYVLENGRIVMQGTGADLLVDPKVRDAYLGG